MKISVITPFYEGDKYMDAYIAGMESNRRQLMESQIELEVILVNDSPWAKLEAVPASDPYIHVITNESNQGIHYSRVAGLLASSGDYIMFLDQDDLIKEDALLRMCGELANKNADIVIANASLEQNDGAYLTWYRTKYHLDHAWDLKTYLNIGIQIISPGQCLIKRGAIPEFWLNNLVRVNGADDYYLWILMMAKGAKACTLDAQLYIHKFTGTNISSETEATDASVYDFIDLLYDCDYIQKEDIIRLHEMITYKAQFRKSSIIGKVGCSLANLDIFIQNLRFKYLTKTGYGFNR